MCVRVGILGRFLKNEAVVHIKAVWSMSLIYGVQKVQLIALSGRCLQAALCEFFIFFHLEQLQAGDEYSRRNLKRGFSRWLSVYLVSLLHVDDVSASKLINGKK